MATVRYFSSTDAGAPVLANTAGSMIALLDAILVNGYGANASLGWTKEYTGTNLAAYKTGLGSNGRYLRVDDTGTTDARVVGYETMTGISAGTALFPTALQLSGGEFWSKPNFSGGAWRAVGNENTLYLWVMTTNATTYSANAVVLAFGDFKSYKSGDAYNTFIHGGTATGVSNNSFGTLTQLAAQNTGLYAARNYTQLGSSVAIGKHGDHGNNGNVTTMSAGGIAYPNPVDGSMYYTPIWLHETVSSSNVVRGYLPGIWNMNHNRPLLHGDRFQGTGAHSTKTFEVWDFYNGAMAAVEVSNTWA